MRTHRSEFFRLSARLLPGRTQGGFIDASLALFQRLAREYQVVRL